MSSQLTYTGKLVSPRSGAPSLKDIAVAQGRICRFAGQGRRFYPVLLHSMLVHDLADPDVRSWALFHDAEEVCVGDTPTMFKIPNMALLGDLIRIRIFKSLGLGIPSKEQWRRVKEADRRAIVAEFPVVGPPGIESQPYVSIPDKAASDQLAHYLNGFSVSDCVEPEGAAVSEFIMKARWYVGS